MRAIVITAPGGPEVLELREVDEPTPGPGQVRIQVAATAVNRADLMQRAGQYPAPLGAPSDIPGLEYAGEVESLGPGVTRWKVGDRVMGLVGGGAYAERLVAHEREVAPVPAGMKLTEAAALPEALLTAWDAIVTRGRLGAGDRLLVHAVASGVGTAATQIGRALGAHAIGTSRSAAKLDRCKPLGLDQGVVVGSPVVFADEVKKLTGGRGVDVVLDLVGGDYVPESLAACASRARLILVGLTGGRKASLDLGLILSKRLEIVGTVMRARPLEEKIDAAQLLTSRLVPLVEQGRLAPVIDRVMPLAEAADAHRYLASNDSFGKVVLTVGLANPTHPPPDAAGGGV